MLVDPPARFPPPPTCLLFHPLRPADALENYTQVKAVYQSLEPNQPWL